MLRLVHDAVHLRDPVLEARGRRGGRARGDLRSEAELELPLSLSLSLSLFVYIYI